MDDPLIKEVISPRREARALEWHTRLKLTRAYHPPSVVDVVVKEFNNSAGWSTVFEGRGPRPLNEDEELARKAAGLVLGSEGINADYSTPPSLMLEVPEIARPLEVPEMWDVAISLSSMLFGAEELRKLLMNGTNQATHLRRDS